MANDRLRFGDLSTRERLWLFVAFVFVLLVVGTVVTVLTGGSSDESGESVARALPYL